MWCVRTCAHPRIDTLLYSACEVIYFFFRERQFDYLSWEYVKRAIHLGQRALYFRKEPYVFAKVPCQVFWHIFRGDAIYLLIFSKFSRVILVGKYMSTYCNTYCVCCSMLTCICRPIPQIQHTLQYTTTVQHALRHSTTHVWIKRRVYRSSVGTRDSRKSQDISLWVGNCMRWLRLVGSLDASDSTLRASTTPSRNCIIKMLKKRELPI